MGGVSSEGEATAAARTRRGAGRPIPGVPSVSLNIADLLYSTTHPGGFTSRARVWILATWTGYLLAFPFLHDLLGDLGAVGLFVPLLTTAWWTGLRGAVLAAPLALLGQMVLFRLTGHAWGWEMVAGAEGLVALLGVLVVTLLAGAQRDVARRLEATAVAKDRLVASVSHEVRTPLTGVLGLAGQLRDALDELSPDEVRELAGLIAEQAEEASAIVEDLLVAARSEHGQVSVSRQPVDLRALVDGVTAVSTTRVDRVEGAATACGDPRRIRQVLRNLIVNAHRHGRGEVTVVLGAEGPWAWLEVRDEGEGIPDSYLEAAFQPFAPAARHHRDSVGLGLFVSRQLAELMGGRLEHQRREGASVFRLQLPRSCGE